jgi:hypothetical protein
MCRWAKGKHLRKYILEVHTFIWESIQSSIFLGGWPKQNDSYNFLK